MNSKTSRKRRREDYDRFDDGADDLTITPYMSGAEFCKRFASSGKGKGENQDASAASADRNSDLGNKDSEGFKARRRRRSREESAPEEKRERSKRGRNVGSEPGDRGESVGPRVIGGIFRGAKLLYAGDRRVRPMKDRVREAIFNLLGESVKGKRVVDLFAGTGALSFEAISRGARCATAFEIHFPTARTARDNIAILDAKVPGTAKKIELVATDVYVWGRRLAAGEGNDSRVRSPIESSFRPIIPTDVPWLVFCSPPYDFFVDREEETLELLQTLRDRAPRGSVFVVEADDRFDFDLLGVEIPPKKRRSYPPAEIGIFTA